MSSLLVTVVVFVIITHCHPCFKPSFQNSLTSARYIRSATAISKCLPRAIMWNTMAHCTSNVTNTARGEKSTHFHVKISK